MPLPGFQELIDHLGAFDFGIEMRTIVEENKWELPDLVREQLAEGKDGDNQPNTIFGRDEYAETTIEIKEQHGVGLGAVTDRITNYMTGAFYNSIKIETEGDVFEAKSPVPYFDEIVEYSDDAFLEVNEEHRRQFAEAVTLPDIKKILLEKTGLIITSK